MNTFKIMFHVLSNYFWITVEDAQSFKVLNQYFVI